MKIILLGPPGAGKGTEGELLAREFGLKRLSVGALLRRLIKEKTPTGKEAKECVRRGLNIPPSILSSLLSRWLSANENGYIIDNFPRSQEQLELFKRLIKAKKIGVDKVFHLYVSPQTSLQRLFTRRKKRQELKIERIDESSGTIKDRYQIGYEGDIGKILEYFKNLGVLEKINAEQSIQKVHQDIMNRLSKP